MKKSILIITAAILTSLMTCATTTLAMTETAEPINQIISAPTNQTDASNYLKFSGTISSITQDGKLSKLTVDNGKESGLMIFPITDDVLIFNSGTTNQHKKDIFVVGQKVEVYYDKNKPMPLIYPAAITPKIVIIHDTQQMGSVKVSKFDKNLLSLDNDLKLNISNETVLLNQKGEEIRETDLKNKELIVFHTISTKSLPAQTTPTKIIALYSTNDNIYQIIDKDHYLKSGVKMVPIRKVSEHLGYKVEWQGKTSSVHVRKQASSYLIFIGKKEFGLNKSLRRFEATPEIKNGRTYVPESFVRLLLN